MVAAIAPQADEIFRDYEVRPNSGLKCHNSCCACCCPYIWGSCNLIQLNDAWTAPSADDSSEEKIVLLNQKIDNGDGRAPGPFVNYTTINRHKLIKERLEAFASMEEQGLVDRDPGHLGFTPYTGMWPENKAWTVGQNTIALGASKADHDKMRPLIAKLMGSSELTKRWTTESLRALADKFFEEHQAGFDTDVHIQVWVQQVLHKIVLDIDLTAEEAMGVFGLFNGFAVHAFLPCCAGLAASPVLRLAGMGKSSLISSKRVLMARYEAALVALLPEAASLSAPELQRLASTCLDSFLFAGGRSLVTVLPNMLQLPHSAWGKRNLPGGDAFALHNLSETERRQYAWEVLRRFPAVGGFTYTERPSGQRVVLALSQAMRYDPDAWGKDAGKFVLRPLDVYEKTSVAFGEGAHNPNDEAWPSARICPGKPLALAIIDAFLAAYQAAEQQSGKRWVSLLEPKELKVNAMGMKKGWLVLK